MVSIGTLGGVWANESWGRYWGWDAKTWALVTILVYSFILHMRFIPGLKVCMRSTLLHFWLCYRHHDDLLWCQLLFVGLHSYAAGDPVPIPSQVYYTAITLTVPSVAAFVRYRSKFENGLFL